MTPAPPTPKACSSCGARFAPTNEHEPCPCCGEVQARGDGEAPVGGEVKAAAIDGGDAGNVIGESFPGYSAGAAESIEEGGEASAASRLLEELATAFPDYGDFEWMPEAAEICSKCRARDGFGGTVLLQVIKGGLAGTGDVDAESFYPDRALAESFDHAAVVRFRELRRQGAYDVLVTNMPRGRALEEWVRDENPKPGRVLNLAMLLCQTLRDLHDRGVVHRMLNPKAIYVDENDTPQILGAGFSNLLYRGWEEELRGAGKLPRDYIAPECRIDGMTGADALADVFSTGVLLYELLTGILPRGSFVPMPSEKVEVDSHIDDGVLRAMNFERKERPQNMVEMLEVLAGLRRREAPGGEARSKRDGRETPTRELQVGLLDGQLGWVKAVSLWGTVAVLLVVGTIFTVKNFLDGDDSVEEWELLSFLVKMERAEALMEAQKKLEAIAEILSAIKSADGVSVEDVKRLAEVLAKGNEYERISELTKELVKKADSRAEDFGAVIEEQLRVVQWIGAFLDARELAATARAREERYPEYEALLLARKLMPEDPEVKEWLHANPVYVETEVLGGLGQLMRDNSGAVAWRWQLEVERDGAYLNLAGNESLVRIDALAGLPIAELDLSGTGVQDLEAMRGMNLKVLRIDGSKVSSLAPLHGMPLEILSFENAAVTGLVSWEAFPSLEVYRGHVNGLLKTGVGAPRGRERWENEMGIRFRALPGNSVLVGEREIGFGIYAEYTKARRQAFPPVALSYQEGAWKNQGHTWKDPGYPIQPTDPVAGVSREDAEDFCEWLTERDRRAGLLENGQLYRLPTDLEWSQAAGLRENPLLSARARSLQGEQEPVAHREHVEHLAEGIATADEAFAHGGGSLPGSEPWRGPSERFQSSGGIFGLGSSVREWCRDPAGADMKRYVVRGPGAGSREVDLARREAVARNARYMDLGFRIVLQLSATSQEHRLPWLLGREKWQEAGEVALLQGIAEMHPDVREAGKTYLKLQNFVLDRKRVVPDTLLGIETFEDRRYYLAKLPLSWEEAGKFSEALGGHLLTIGSSAEEAWVLETFFGGEFSPLCWIGASTTKNDSRWKWVTGEALRYQPEDLPRPGGAEEGLLLERTGDPAAPARWTADARKEAYFFVIEWEPGKGERKARPPKKEELAVSTAE